jgi:hypothetical protein
VEVWGVAPDMPSLIGLGKSGPSLCPAPHESLLLQQGSRGKGLLGCTLAVRHEVKRVVAVR